MFFVDISGDVWDRHKAAFFNFVISIITCFKGLFRSRYRIYLLGWGLGYVVILVVFARIPDMPDVDNGKQSTLCQK